jgi:hypothetical protein
MRRLLAFVSLAMVWPFPSGAQQQARPVSVKTTSQTQESVPQTQVPDLPVRRVVLYKNGVSYNSTDPLDKRLGALRLPLDEQTSVSKFRYALRGSRLEVSIGAK